MEQVMEEVRCADCGFLGLRNGKTGALNEADERFRKEAFFRGSPPTHDNLPICSKSVVDFRDETNPGNQDGICQALRKDRSESCNNKFMTWRKGFTPKDHHEMQLAQELQLFQIEQRERERDWQQRQEATNRDWQIEQEQKRKEEQAALNKARDDRDEAKDFANRRWQVGIAICAVVATLASGIGGVLLTNYLSQQRQQPSIQTNPKTEPTHKN